MDLIKISQKETGNIVDARELHAFLENKRSFPTWITSRIGKYQFVEDVDYTLLKYDVYGNLLNDRLNPKVETDNEEVKSHKIDYAITIQMAMELSMIESNDKGRQARKYFIAAEERLRKVLSIPNFANPAEAARMWALQFEQKQLSDGLILELTPKAEYCDKVLKSDSTMAIRSIAKDFGLTPQELNKILHEQKIQFSDGSRWHLYAEHKNEGYAQSKTYIRDGNEELISTTKNLYWTERGKKFIVQLLIDLGHKTEIEVSIEQPQLTGTKNANLKQQLKNMSFVIAQQKEQLADYAIQTSPYKCQYHRSDIVSLVHAVSEFHGVPAGIVYNKSYNILKIKTGFDVVQKRMGKENDLDTIIRFHMTDFMYDAVCTLRDEYRQANVTRG